MAAAKKKSVKRKPKIKDVKTLFQKVMENIKIISVFSFTFMVIGFCLGVYSDVMKIDTLEENIVTLNKKIDKLVELIIGNSSEKFEEKSKAPKILGEE